VELLDPLLEHRDLARLAARHREPLALRGDEAGDDRAERLFDFLELRDRLGHVRSFKDQLALLENLDDLLVKLALELLEADDQGLFGLLRKAAVRERLLL